METPRRSVCVIDDDRDIRDTIRFVLEIEGIAVTDAPNGSEGFACLRAGCPVGLILLDLMMPGMSGWEFRRRQLEDPTLASIPVVVLSGASRVERHARELGADGYLIKPVDRNQLLQTIGTSCSKRSRAMIAGVGTSPSRADRAPRTTARDQLLANDSGPAHSLKPPSLTLPERTLPASLRSPTGPLRIRDAPRSRAPLQARRTLRSGSMSAYARRP
jgi:CheY-like chemotaxis protein